MVRHQDKKGVSFDLEMGVAIGVSAIDGRLIRLTSQMNLRLDSNQFPLVLFSS